MKKKTISTIIVVALVISATTIAVANGAVQEINAWLRPDITIIIDGGKETFSDVNGNTVYPILYNGTTYLPVRAIGEIMGKDIGWDALFLI